MGKSPIKNQYTRMKQMMAGKCDLTELLLSTLVVFNSFLALQCIWGHLLIST